MSLDLPALPTLEDLRQAERRLNEDGFTWVDQGAHWHEHLARHAPGSLTVGSKFSAVAWQHIDQLAHFASRVAMIELAKALVEGRPLRAQVVVPLANAGTQGVASNLVCAGLSTLTRARIWRDPGTAYAQEVEVVVLTVQKTISKHNLCLRLPPQEAG